ncbi:hypothetical protein [Streptomyces sp. Inha503]|uniref:hypothetical protein n=1 Tax=Streptomyces sp. Inha503 TaxID=3383314 RepID=UPI00399EF21D
MPTTREPADIPAWPVYDLTVHDDGRVLSSGPLISTSGHSTRAAAVHTVADVAARLGRPVRARATEPDGTVWHLTISPDGEVGEIPGDGPRAAVPRKRHAKRAAKAAATDPAAAASESSGAGSRARMGPGARTDSLSQVVESLSQVTDHLEAGRVDQATSLVAQLDEQAASALGVSHPDALRIREVRARVTALAGDPVGGVRLYRDVAERWYYQGDGEQAEAVAGRAEALWRQITDPEQALSAGDAVIRMRNQIPGSAGDALTAAVAHQARLMEAHTARSAPNTPHAPHAPSAHDANGPGTREPSVAKSPALPRPRPVLTWERPAVQARPMG